MGTIFVTVFGGAHAIRSVFSCCTPMLTSKHMLLNVEYFKDNENHRHSQCNCSLHVNKLFRHHFLLFTYCHVILQMPVGRCAALQACQLITPVHRRAWRVAHLVTVSPITTWMATVIASVSICFKVRVQWLAPDHCKLCIFLDHPAVFEINSSPN